MSGGIKKEFFVYDDDEDEIDIDIDEVDLTTILADSLKEISMWREMYMQEAFPEYYNLSSHDGHRLIKAFLAYPSEELIKQHPYELLLKLTEELNEK
jgi:hypothetical protein